LKTKGNTPKYGLLYHSSFIGRAEAKNKGRISRFLANKCSIASRIDTFSETPSSKYGEALRQQVEERLEFYATGAAPTKNSDAMQSAMDATLADINVNVPKDDAPSRDIEMLDMPDRTVSDEKTKKKRSKEEKKKRKQAEAEGNGELANGEKKKKKKKKSHPDSE